MYVCIVDNIQLAPPCWVMPQQYEEFAGATTNLRSDNKMFFTKPMSSASGWRSRVVNLEKLEDIEYTRRSFVIYYSLWLYKSIIDNICLLYYLL